MRTVHSALWNSLLKCICRWIHCATWSFNKPNQIIFSPSHITLFMNKVLRFWTRLYFHKSGINRFATALRKAHWLITNHYQLCNLSVYFGYCKKEGKKRGRDGCKCTTWVSLSEYFWMPILWIKTYKNYCCREIYNNCHLGIFHSSSLSLVPALTAILAVAQLYYLFRILSGSSVFKYIRPRLRYCYVAPGAIAFL